MVETERLYEAHHETQFTRRLFALANAA
jgi:hypothetical protein